MTVSSSIGWLVLRIARLGLVTVEDNDVLGAEGDEGRRLAVLIRTEKHPKWTLLRNVSMDQWNHVPAHTHAIARVNLSLGVRRG